MARFWSLLTGLLSLSLGSWLWALSQAASMKGSASTSDKDSSPIRFEDVTASAGIQFTHDRGASDRRYMVEIAGGGVIVLDYDGDGLPDLYFVNGAPLPGSTGPAPGNALYRNRGDRTFVDVTDAAGVRGGGYGMGGASADIDNDGDSDLFVTAFGPDLLYRNNGDGTFTEVSAKAGFGDPRWSTSATFVDINADGLVDLYVCNYLDFTLENHKRCFGLGKKIEAYCHPEEYNGVGDLLYLNRGDGTFQDISETAGVVNPAEGKGLGVVAGDYDNDGDPDLYVANDTTRNFLYRNDGGGNLTDVGLESGVGFNEKGLPEAGMGTDWGDMDRDGWLDLIVTNFDFEKNTLYRNLGGGLFIDGTSAAGLGDRSMTELGFGCDLADFDNDGWLDLAIVNGHILDNIAEIQPNLTFAQPGQFFRNVGGRFQDLSLRVGEPLRRERVGRGLATLDFDRDGDLDLVLANNGGPAELLRNDGGNAKPWVGIRFVGVQSNRDGIGARAETELSGLPVIEEVRAGSSYLSQNELTVYLGLGRGAEAVDLRVRWPTGKVDKLPTLPVRAVYVVKEGVGVVATTAPGPFASKPW